MKTRVRKEMMEAMKNKNSERKSVLSLIVAKLTEAEKEAGKQPDEVSVLDSMVKERNKSIEAYISAGRKDLADKEQYEIDVISEFLPKRMSLEEIELVANSAIILTNATSLKDMGRVVGLIKKECGDSAKPSDIAQVVKSLLS